MGAWGFKNFENDDAADFYSSLIEDHWGAREIYDVINEIAKIATKEDSDYGPEAPESNVALAAIEFIAAAKGNPSADFPEEGKKWLQKNDPLDIKFGDVFGLGGKEIDMVALGKQAIKQIKDNSELKELWEETKDYQNWLAVLDDLEKRIS